MTARAFFAGVTGAAIIAIVNVLARAAGVPYDIEHVWGSLLTGADGARGGVAYLLGLLVSLYVGGALGIVYVRLLARASQPTMMAGAFMGLLHAVIAGVLVAALPPFHPAIPEAIAAPGLLMLEWGSGASILHLVMHVAFGMWMSHVVITPHPVLTQAAHA